LKIKYPSPILKLIKSNYSSWWFLYSRKN